MRLPAWLRNCLSIAVAWNKKSQSHFPAVLAQKSFLLQCEMLLSTLRQGVTELVTRVASELSPGWRPLAPWWHGCQCCVLSPDNLPNHCRRRPISPRPSLFRCPWRWLEWRADVTADSWPKWSRPSSRTHVVHSFFGPIVKTTLERRGPFSLVHMVSMLWDSQCLNRRKSDSTKSFLKLHVASKLEVRSKLLSLNWLSKLRTMANSSVKTNITKTKKHQVSTPSTPS